MRKTVSFMLAAVALMLLAACSKSPAERMEALYDDAKKNWKDWNQQDWVDFYKEKEQIYLDFYEADGTVEEKEKLEKVDADAWKSWQKDDKDFDRMLQGTKELDKIWIMMEKADPQSGDGEAFFADKDASAVFDKLEKACEKWEKAHKDELKEPSVTAEELEELEDE